MKWLSAHSPLSVGSLMILVMAAMLAVLATACESSGQPEPTATNSPAAQQPSADASPAPTSQDTASESPSATPPPGDAPTPQAGESGERSLDIGIQVTPPALLPGTTEPTAPALQDTSTSTDDGTPLPDEPTPPPPTTIPPTETPTSTPIPPTAPPPSSAPPVGTGVGDSAPGFEVTTVDGVSRSLTDFKQANQSVILYFFSST